MILTTPIPEVRLEDLQARVDELHDLERDAQLALGEAVLRRLPGRAARAEIDRVRRELTGLYAAMRVAEITLPEARR